MELVECVATVADVDGFVERLGVIGDEQGVTIQAFDARYVVDRGHLERAVALADRAIARGENVARSRAVEILCYAAGRRQIERALELGVAAGEGPAVVLVDAGPAGGGDGNGGHDAADATRERDAVVTVESRHTLERRPTLGDYDPGRVREFFDVSDAELATVDGDLAALVHERVALLDVEK